MTQQEYKDLFLLDQNITFLNFGSFGACPKEIFQSYQNFQLQFEREPIQFMVNHGPALLKKSREALGGYIGCDADDVVFTPNPSYAINIVAKSLQLQPGDEILTTDIEYGAMDKTWNYYSQKGGYVYKRQPIRLPITSKEDFIEQFWSGLSPKTKVVFIGQITSSTALILPVAEICKKAKELGLLTIVDGAHVAAHIPLDLKNMYADIYTGACHKWMMAPKGCSFLYANKENQKWMDPLVVSWGYDSTAPSHSQFLDYHQQQGTRDFSAFLTVPDCLAFMEKYDWQTVRDRSRKIVIDNVTRFAELLGSSPHAPVNENFFGQMCSLPIKTESAERLKNILYNDYRIEIPVIIHGDKIFIRYSINGFNSMEDLDILFSALKNLIEKGIVSHH